MEKEPSKENEEEVSNPYQGKVFKLPYSARRRIMVGRSSAKKYTEKGLSLSKDGEVSTSHGHFRTSKGVVCFEDLDSTNGSRLNGELLTPHKCYPLEGGHVLALGATNMRVTFA